jgi:hypothetical protein
MASAESPMITLRMISSSIHSNDEGKRAVKEWFRELAA